MGKFLDDDVMYIGYREDDETQMFNSLNNEYYKDQVSIKNVQSLLCTFYTTNEDGETVESTYHCSTEEALRSNYVWYDCYGDYKRISYKDLMMNLPLIDFKYMLRVMDDNSINPAFVDIFKVAELYPNELSVRLKFDNEKHAAVIDKFAERLNWKSIISKNDSLSNEQIKNYFKYFCDKEIFYKNKMQTYYEDILKFIFTNILDNYNDPYKFYTETKNLISDLISTHKFTEDQLFVMLDTVRKYKNLEKTRLDWFFDTVFESILTNQNVSENLILRFKLKSLYKRNKARINLYVKFTENFIKENCDNSNFINWDTFSENENILYGEYPDEFYETYHDKIVWKKFNKDELRRFKEYNQKRFKEFLIKFNKYIDSDIITKILKDHSEKSFSVKEMLKYFNEQLKTTENMSYDRYFGNNDYSIAVCKAGNPNFSMALWLKSERTKSDKDLQAVKFEILDSLIKGNLRGLDGKMYDRINSMIEDKDILSKKKEIFTEMLDGNYQNKLPEIFYNRINKVLGQV